MYCVPTSSIADAWKSVTRTNRAEAVNRTKVVKATAVTTFLRRRSLAVIANTSPSSSSSSSSPASSSSQSFRRLCIKSGGGITGGSSFQMTQGVSEKTTFFLLRMFTRLIRKQGSRPDPAANENCCWSLCGDNVASGCLLGSLSWR